jgi:peptide deformylase
LAAPQIGKSLRIFLAKYQKLDRLVINPEILAISQKHSKVGKKDKNKEILEGCLSLPHYYGPLKRENSVKLKYLNQRGEEVIEEFKDFDAQIILHEIDHLNGVLFIDRLLEKKKPLYHVDGKKWEEVELI